MSEEKEPSEEAAHRNGLGQSIVNTNSENFRGLKSKIEADAVSLDEVEQMENALFALHLRMRAYVETTLPEEQMSVGAFVKLHLGAVGVKNKVFAQYVQLEASNLSAVLSGRRKLNSDLALKLEKLFAVPALLWLQVQNKNELMTLRATTPDKYKKYTLQKLLEKKV